MVKVKKHVDVDGSEYWTSNIHKQLFEINGYDLHREDGPAIIFSTGEKCWFRYGKRHREDGPAVIRESGKYEWWLDDVYYSFEEWTERMKFNDEEKTIMKLKYG